MFHPTCPTAPPLVGRSEMADTDADLIALEKAYARWSETKGANVDEILDLFDDKIVMRSVLSDDIDDPISGTHVSKAEAAEYFAGLLKDWEMISYDKDRFISDGKGNIVWVGRCAWRNRAT